MITHLDLFAGIGGFSLAADRVWGRENVKHIFCEIEPFPQKVLMKHWPDAELYHDIKELDGTAIKDVHILTGGFPCQPYSVSGKQRGEKDDRALWPEMLRVISETRPHWVIGENVGGFVGMGLDGCLLDLAGAGYDCQPLVIPACAVDAKHRRDRIWIVCHSKHNGPLATKIRRSNKEPQEQARTDAQRQSAGASSIQSDVANTEIIRRHEKQTQDTSTSWSRLPGEARRLCGPKSGSSWIPEPGMGRVVARISSTLDETIKAYGYEHADTQKAVSEIDSIRREILREMWGEQQETKPASCGEETRRSDDLVYEVSCQRTYDRWKLGQRFESEPGLRDMWQRVCASGFSQTQNVQTRMLERVREIERNETVAPSRVDRIKCLGNSIVPQIAERIMRAISQTGDTK